MIGNGSPSSQAASAKRTFPSRGSVFVFMIGFPVVEVRAATRFGGVCLTYLHCIPRAKSRGANLGLSGPVPSAQ